MEIKNAFNILFAKFNINYRVLFYMFITITIVLAISVSILIPVVSEVFNSPETETLFNNVRQQLGSFISGDASYKDFAHSVRAFFDGVSDLWQGSGASAVFWVTFVLMCALIRFVASISYPAIVDIINSFMSSNMSYGFLSNLIKNFKTGVVYSFMHTLITMIADILIAFATYGIISVFLPLINLFAFAIGLVFVVIALALRMTFSAGVVPEMVVGGESNYFKALKKSWPNVRRRFKQIFGAYCITVFTTYCVVAVLMLPTFGVAFFIMAAMFVTYNHIVQLVFYYGSKNMRYYTDPNTIVNTAPIEDRIDLQEELISHDDND